MDDSQPNLAFIRPYTPDIFGLLAKLGQTSAYYDANGHYARVSPAASNIYQYDAGSNSLQTIFTERDKQFDDLTFSNGLRRCPGGGTQQAADLSNPFLDDGNLTAADCDPSALPPP